MQKTCKLIKSNPNQNPKQYLCQHKTDDSENNIYFINHFINFVQF